jgi:methyl-accepting chemotaxis protein
MFARCARSLQRVFRAEARRVGNHHLCQADDGVERRAQLVAHNVRSASQRDEGNDRARRDIDTATAQAYSVQTFGGAVQLGVVALSLISSVLIVWLYVGRNIVARLMNLSGIMTAIAGGSRSVAVPVAGTDEIGAMGRAVEIFRRNAVDLDQLIAERAEAAARLERLEPFGRGLRCKPRSLSFDINSTCCSANPQTGWRSVTLTALSLLRSIAWLLEYWTH